MPLTVAQLSELLGIAYQGDGSIEISAVASLENARPGQLGFLSDHRYRNHLLTTKASAVIVAPEDVGDCPATVLISRNVYSSYARAAVLLSPEIPIKQGIDPAAIVDVSAQIADSAWIGPQSVIDAGAIIRDHVQIGPGCVIAAGVELGEHSILVARVTVLHNVTIGKRVLLHPGAVVGSDGFGMANEEGRWVKIPQAGGVRIGDDVDIGANSTIDRGALDDTIIEEGVKIDNQVQVAHNVVIGAHTAIAGCVGISGSARIGKYCMLAGGVGVVGHIEIADHVHITAMSMVTHSIGKPGTYSAGTPLMQNNLWLKSAIRFKKLDGLYRRLCKLEKTVKGK